MVDERSMRFSTFFPIVLCLPSSHASLSAARYSVPHHITGLVLVRVEGESIEHHGLLFNRSRSCRTSRIHRGSFLCLLLSFLFTPCCLTWILVTHQLNPFNIRHKYVLDPLRSVPFSSSIVESFPHLLVFSSSLHTRDLSIRDQRLDNDNSIHSTVNISLQTPGIRQSRCRTSQNRKASNSQRICRPWSTA